MRRTSRLTALTAVVALTVALLPLAGAAGDDTSDYVIPFHSGAVDPVADLIETDPAERDLVLVQWQDYGDSQTVRDIAATGATLVQPLAPVSYLVWADAVETEAIRDLETVRFAGVLPPEARVAANVDDATTALRVTFVGDADLADIGEVHVRKRAFTAVDGAIATIAGDADAAAAIAADPRVYSVADAGRDIALRDEQSSSIMTTGTEEGAPAGVHGDFLAERDIDGDGVTVHIMDGGVDFNHPDLLGQDAACFDAGPPACAVANNNDDVIGHGTHVLGNILGTGTTPLTDLDGFSYGLGMAPGADAVAHNDISLWALTTGFPDGYTARYTEAVREGAIVSNNSWGPAGTPQGYDADTREFDQIARDADPDTPGEQPLALSWSIMNGSGGESTQGAPDEGKNLLAVGGSGARQADVGGEGHGPDDLCTCTAHGPNLDGRQLVDFVAPAEHVVSARATQGALCGSGATGVLGIPAFVMEPPSPLHGPCTGTSFASPHVTGATALFVDWLRAEVYDDADATPSPALVKAAFANRATDLSEKGGVDADGRPLEPIPNDRQGWGRVDLGATLDAWETGAVFVDQDVAFTDSGESHTLEVEPVDADEPLHVTLAWTDAPGHGQGGELPAWVNDLDLVVDAPDGTTYLGNVFDGGVSAPGGQPDPMNNLENVHLPEPIEGSYTVTVDAANIIGQASPHAEVETWQDFALVITGGQLVGGDEAHASSTGLERAGVTLPEPARPNR